MHYLRDVTVGKGACLGLVPAALALALFLAGMRTTPAPRANIVTLLEPVTATVLTDLSSASTMAPRPARRGIAAGGVDRSSRAGGRARRQALAYIGMAC